MIRQRDARAVRAAIEVALRKRGALGIELARVDPPAFGER